MDRAAITWFVFGAVSVCYGLGVWESIQIHRSQESHGVSYVTNLPPIVFTPMFRVVKLFGQFGILIAPWMILNRGIIWVIGAAFALFIGGTIMGGVISRSVDAMVKRGIGL
jgi:hypothetical protein